jgi:hypothetical protein
MSVTAESDAKITKAVDDIIAVLKRVEEGFTADETILFSFRLVKAMEKEGISL